MAFAAPVIVIGIDELLTLAGAALAAMVGGKVLNDAKVKSQAQDDLSSSAADGSCEDCDEKKKENEKKKEGDKPGPSKPPPDFDWHDPTKPPSRPGGPEWKWKGKQPVGGDKGAWDNPDASGGRESLHPDFDHEPGIDPHWDYNDTAGGRWRIFEDGSIKPK